MTTDGDPRPQPVPTLVILKSGLMLCGIMDGLDAWLGAGPPVLLRYPARVAVLDLPGQSKMGSLAITSILTYLVFFGPEFVIQRSEIAAMSEGAGPVFDEYLARTAAWRLGDAPRIVPSS